MLKGGQQFGERSPREPDMGEQRLVVTFDPGEEGRAMLERTFAGSARLTFLGDVSEGERAAQLSAADVLLSWVPARELGVEEFGELGGARFMQLLSAGADGTPFARLPPTWRSRATPEPTPGRWPSTSWP